MELNKQERELIDSKIKDFNCPFCGGKIVHFIQQFQLLCIPNLNNATTSIELSKENLLGYLCGECQNCGYTILRRLDVLLRDMNKPESNPTDNATQTNTNGNECIDNQ